MAKIILNVQLDKNSVSSVNSLNTALKKLTTTIAKMQAIPVNNKLTKQLDALAKSWNASARAAEKVTKINNQNAIAEEKLAKVHAKTTTELEKQRKATANANIAEEKLVKIKRQNEQATQKLNKKTEEGTEANEKHTQSILSMAKGFFQWQMAATLVMQPLNLIQNAISSINETLINTENRIIELKRVVGDAANAGELYKIAQAYGQTFENVSEAALNFARRGMSWAESIKATESAMLALNVAELDVAQATDGLGSIMAQFDIEVESLTEVVDKLNKTADNFPVTTEKILKALQRVGSTASTANLTLDETIGLITTLSKATNRSGENIGTALNSIINIASSSNALDIFAGLSDNSSTAVEKFRSGAGSILEVLSAVSSEVKNRDTASLLNDEEFAALNEELKNQMGEDFEILSDIYGTAGTYRRNYFIALLDDLETVQEVQDEIANAQGYSAKENEQYLDTYEAKLNSLKAQWQKIANDEQGILGVKKALVDIGSWLLKVFDALGGIKTVLAVIVPLAVGFVGKKTILGLSKWWENIWKINFYLDDTSKKLSKAEIAAMKFNKVATILSIVGAVVGLVVGHLQKQKEAEEEAREAAIANWETTRDNYKELVKLSEEYKKAEATGTDLNEIEKQLVETLGEKADILSGLTKGTEEYTKALKNLSAEELKKRQQELTTAFGAAKTELENYDIAGYGKGFLGITSLGNAKLNEEEKDIAKKAGIDVNTMGAKSAPYYGLNFYEDTNTVESTLKNYAVLKDVVDKLYKEYFKTLDGGDTAYADKVLSFYTRLSGELSAAKEVVDTYETIKKELEDINNISKETDEESTEEWNNSLEQVSDKYDDLLAKIKEMRNTQKEENDLLEKRQALLDAQNERNVRVFNAETGQWEWQANQKNIDKAEEALEEAGWDKIENELEKAIDDDGIKISNETINDIVKAVGLDGFGKTAAEMIKAVTGVDISALAEYVPSSVVDANLKSRGILVGASDTSVKGNGGMVSNMQTNNNNSKTYMVNGIPVFATDAEKYTVAELFENMGLVD